MTVTWTCRQCGCEFDEPDYDAAELSECPSCGSADLQIEGVG